MRSPLWPFAAAVARRNVRSAVRDPALWVPPLAFPLFSLVALAGGLSGRALRGSTARAPLVS